MYVRAGRLAFVWPYAGVHRSTSLMSSSLLLQQCPACLVHLICIVFVMGGRWPYSWCLVVCYFRLLLGLHNIRRKVGESNKSCRPKAPRLESAFPLVRAQSNKGRLGAVKPLVSAGPSSGGRASSQFSRARTSARALPSLPLAPHYNRPSGRLLCVKSCLVGSNDKYMEPAFPPLVHVLHSTASSSDPHTDEVGVMYLFFVNSKFVSWLCYSAVAVQYSLVHSFFIQPPLFLYLLKSLFPISILD